ncbi:MAG: DUF1294 domain-containing protein [Ruminococcus sp.]|nr:DUF1294 domain-containing protein [Ruminococcus sp.]MBR0302880.1 DUF1294 domain-containing protein [Clostridia bacterium]
MLNFYYVWDYLPYILLIGYFVLINVYALIITAKDKINAKRHRHRVPEEHLIVVAAIGGAPLMYLTMVLIRHKTKKPIFMIGIPVLFFLELLVAFLLLHFVFHVF